MDEAFAALDEILRRRPGETYRARGWWGRSPLWQRVREEALAAPDRPAVIDDEGRYGYGELWRLALRVARALRAEGVGRGDPILVQLPNWREVAAIAVGAEVAGAVFGFCPIAWQERETVRGLNLVQPRLWLTAGRLRDAGRGDFVARCLEESGSTRAVLLRGNAQGDTGWEDWLAAAPDGPEEAVLLEQAGRGGDPLEIAVTSGTTGDPKGVVHVHDTALAAVDSTILRQGIGRDDVIHVALPVGHTFGYFYGLRCALQARAALVLQERWDAREMGRLARETGITISLGPAAFLIDLLAAGPESAESLARVWLFTQSGDSLPTPVAERAMRVLPFRISRALGMTEFGHATSTDAATPRERLLDSAGTAQPEMEIRVVGEDGEPLGAGETGRILARGPFVCAGYLTGGRVLEDSIDAQGFFDTGDLGSLDEAGHLHISGRLKQVLRRGAVTVPVADLEDVLAAHDAVVNAVVVGVPDERLGEVPIACLQLVPGRRFGLEDAQALLASRRVTKAFWPARVLVVDAWPVGPTGKIDRERLREMAAAE